MPILIDGFNATHALGFLGSKIDAINQLIEHITPVSINKKVHLFIDGFPFSIEKPKNIHFHFSNNQSADDSIVSFVQSRKKSKLILYTNDSGLKNRVTQFIIVKPISSLIQEETKSKSTTQKSIDNKKEDYHIEEQWFNDLLLLRSKSDD